MTCLSVILLCYTITCLQFCNKKGALFVPDPASHHWASSEDDVYVASPGEKSDPAERICRGSFLRMNLGFQKMFDWIQVSPSLPDEHQVWERPSMWGPPEAEWGLLLFLLNDFPAFASTSFPLVVLGTRYWPHWKPGQSFNVKVLAGFQYRYIN